MREGFIGVCVCFYGLDARLVKPAFFCSRFQLHHAKHGEDAQEGS